jgi:hypothetical protein
MAGMSSFWVAHQRLSAGTTGRRAGISEPAAARPDYSAGVTAKPIAIAACRHTLRALAAAG